MVRIIYGGQLFSQVVNLCVLNKDLLNFEPSIENAGYTLVTTYYYINKVLNLTDPAT